MIVLLTRIATVDMALWDDTRIVPCDSQLWAIGLGVYLDLSAIRSERALFHYNDSCHVNYSAYKVSVP